MPVLIFIVYFLLFSFLLTQIGFIKKSGLTKWVIIALFAIKVLVGLAYSYMFAKPPYKEISDTVRFFSLSLPETDWLLRDPIAFVKDIFSYGYNKPGNLFIGENSYWNDLKSNVIIKLIAICNVLSNKGYYTNVIFFNFLFFFGIIAFYRLLNSLFTVNKWLLLIAIFCMPSFLFWCSGVHKDGLLFSALGLTFWYFHVQLKQGFCIKKSIIVVVVCIALTFMLRNYICLALVMVLCCWYLSHRYNNSIKPFLAIYTLGLMLFFISSIFTSSLNLPKYIVTKQQEFMQLSGGSSVALEKLKPTLGSFVAYLPSAIDMAIFRPHIAEIKNKSYLPAIAEVIFFTLLTFICIIFRKKNITIPSAVYACLFFGISVLAISGYTITFSGAIVRYRSLIIPFIIGPLLCLLDVQKLKSLIKF